MQFRCDAAGCGSRFYGSGELWFSVGGAGLVHLLGQICCRCGSDWFSCGADVVQIDVWCVRVLVQWWFNCGSDVGQSGYRQVVVLGSDVSVALVLTVDLFIVCPIVSWFRYGSDAVSHAAPGFYTDQLWLRIGGASSGRICYGSASDGMLV